MRVAQIATLIVVFSTSITFLDASNLFKALAIRQSDQNAIAQYRVVKNDGHIIQTGDLDDRESTESTTSPLLFPFLTNSLRWFTTSQPANGHLKSLEQVKTKDASPSKCANVQEKTNQMDSLLAFYRKLVIDQLINSTDGYILSLDSVNIMNHDGLIARTDEAGLTIPEWASDWFLKGSFKLANEEFDFVVKHHFQRAMSGVFFKELINMFTNAPEGSVPFYAFNSIQSETNSLVEIIGFLTSTYGEALIFTLAKEDRPGIELFMVNGILVHFIPRNSSSEHTIFTPEKSVQWMIEFSSFQAEGQNSSDTEVMNGKTTEAINNIQKNKIAW